MKASASAAGGLPLQAETLSASDAAPQQHFWEKYLESVSATVFVFYLVFVVWRN